MLKTVFLMAMVAAITLAAPVELPPGVDPACRFTYPNCPPSLTVQQQQLNDLHAANVALEGWKVQQQATIAAQQSTFIQAPAAYVDIIGPDGGVISQVRGIVGPSGEVIPTK